MTTLETSEVVWQGPALHEVREALAPPAPTRPGQALRRMLVVLDAGAAAIGWSTAVALAPRTGGVLPLSVIDGLTAVLLVALTVAAVSSQRLYLARVCAIRAVEINRLARAAALAGVAALLLPRLLPVDLSIPSTVAGAGVSFVLLVAVRGAFRTWLNSGRRQGRFLRPVVIVGANDEAYDLFKLLRDHPETGFVVAGVLGDAVPGVAFPASVERMPIGDDLAGAVRHTGANGVLVASTAFDQSELNTFIRSFLRDGLHVHLSSGLRGVAHRRIRSQPVAHEPFFYVEPTALSTWQLVVKRAIDILAVVVGGVLLLPVLAVVAVAVKLSDRGPVLFSQERVGRDGVPFRIYKFRTMVPNAESLYADLARTHAGREGPLIKLSNDPRRTTVGRFLERLSIDELPQLWNVLRGEMSLVGPRPAQASEIEAFDDELKGRLAVWPGITGLWQVEARDNPSFNAYRRYDLFYIENWSVGLDLGILVATAQRVLLRGITFLFDRSEPELAHAFPRRVSEELG